MMLDNSVTRDNRSNDLPQTSRRRASNAQQSAPAVDPIRLASYEADLSPSLNQIQRTPPPPCSVHTALLEDKSDLSGIRKALDGYRTQPDLIPPVNRDHQSHAVNHELDTTEQLHDSNDISSDQRLFGKRTRGQRKQETLGFSVSSESRQLIERIAYNLLLVLALGVGFIFVAKKWLKPGGEEFKQSISEFEVLNTLKLPNKSNLMLIQVNNDRLLVATDSTGVKSVVHLTDSLDEKPDSYEAYPEQSPVNHLQETRSFVEHLERESSANSFPVPKKKQLEAEAPRRQSTAEKNTEAIQKQMEAALKKFGLKGLV